MNTSMTTDDILDMVTELRRDVDRLNKIVQKYLVSEITKDGYEPRNRFKKVPPKIEEVAERMRERNITSFIAESFFAFYESKGWKIGNVTMKNWDAALTTWANRSHVTALPKSNFIKFYSYNDICLMAQTNDNVWREYVSLQLPDRPKPVWATINDATTNNLMQYRV